MQKTFHVFRGDSHIARRRRGFKTRDPNFSTKARADNKFYICKGSVQFRLIIWICCVSEAVVKEQPQTDRGRGLGDRRTLKRESCLRVKALPMTRSRCRSQQGQISTQPYSSQSEPCSERKISSYLTTKKVNGYTRALSLERDTKQLLNHVLHVRGILKGTASSITFGLSRGIVIMCVSFSFCHSPLR